MLIIAAESQTENMKLALLVSLSSVVMTVAAGNRPALWKQVRTVGMGPQNRTAPASGTIGRNVFIFGGLFDNFAGFQNTFYNDLFKFNTATGRWSEITMAGPIPSERSFSASTSLKQKLYIYGGATYSPDFQTFEVFDDLWSYNSKSNKWKQLTSGENGPGQRSGATLYRDECKNKLYVFGGLNGSFQFFSDVWEFDLKTETWTELVPATGSPVPAGRDITNTGKELINGKIVMYGGEGFEAQTFSFTTLEDVWEFDIASKVWTDRTPARRSIDPHRIFGASELINGDLYIQAGDIPGGVQGCGAPFQQALTDDIWRLRIRPNGIYKWEKVDKFSRRSDKLIDLKRQASSEVNGKMYVFGGFDFNCPEGSPDGTDGQTWNNDVWVFDPKTTPYRRKARGCRRY